MNIHITKCDCCGKQIQVHPTNWQPNNQRACIACQNKREIIERRITTECPLRYSAFEHPRVLFVAQDTALATTKSRELAAYHEPMQNTNYPDLKDGIYAQIMNFQGRSYLAELHATQPWKGRAQKTEHKFFDDFTQAVSWIEEQIPIYRAYCRFNTIEV